MAVGTTEVLLPNLGLEIEDGEIVEWMVAVGDRVERGQVLASIGTDKAESDLEADRDGYVAAILHEEGSRVPVGAPIAVLADEPGGTGDVPAAPAGTAAEFVAAPTAPPAPEEAAPTEGGEPQRVAPIARRLAAENGIDLASVPGSGPRGRVTVEDVKAAIGSANGASVVAAPAPAAAAVAPAEPAALPRLRRLTAERMTLSQQVPQFDVFREVDTASMAGLVARLRDDGVPLSVNDVLVKAYARTLAVHPRLNAAFADGPAIVQHDAVHVGLAVATDGGLMVPVIRDAAGSALAAIAAERKRLVAAAREGAIAAADLSGSTTIVSSLGRFAIDGFNAMVTPPHSAILAVGPQRERPVVREGAVVAAETIILTLTVDHRVVDGAESAAALAALGDLLESEAGLAGLEETT